MSCRSPRSKTRKPGGSLMPKGLANLMTHAEFVDLVRFLAELGKPGPYAIRSTLTIQRWKVLKPVPESLKNEIPAQELLRDQILRSEPGQWVTAYAKAAGSLPLDELIAATASRVLYLQGEISVSSAGPIGVQLDSADGVCFWIDDDAVPAGAATFAPTLASGSHAITFRIDTATRKSREIKVEVAKPPGSPAEFTVVGGH